MNRLLFLSAAAVPLLADASLKGAVLLVLAGVCVLAMRRASAASRHMVWLAAVVALLVLPMLAVVLPGWRVLPQWAVVGAEDGENGNQVSQGKDESAPQPINEPALRPELPVTAPAPFPSAAAPPLSYLSHSSPASHPSPPPAVAVAAAPLTAWLLPLWAAGCAVLLLRLAAAHFLLRRNARRCELATGPLAEALEAAREECGVHRPVRVLVDNARTIPVVWGIFRPQLLLPGEAEHWDATRLRSVLLHELAHLHRRDPLTQLLTQLACALHWFNPLVWLAAWRLHVERERACDDLVLSRGVKPSAYAEHLLHIATQLSPARWTQACGLAMARKSSLEGRLVAVLSDKLNRRSVTRTLAAAAVLLSTAIAVPVAMLRASEEKKPAEGKKEAVPPKEFTADQIIDLVKMSSPLPSAQLSGVLKKDGRETPFTLRMEGALYRFKLENPPQVIQLELGDKSCSLKELTVGAIQEVPAAQYSTGIRGTDLTYDDLSMRYLYWPKKEQKGEDTIKTHRCYVVDLHNPHHVGEYSVVRLFVTKQSEGFISVKPGTIMEMRGFDWSGKLIKSCTINSAMKVPDALGETLYVIKSMEVNRYVPGTMKVAAKTILELAKQQNDTTRGQVNATNSQPPESDVKLDRAVLQGTWMGEKDGVHVDLLFLWWNEHQEARWLVKQRGSNIGADMSAVIEPDGRSARLVFRKDVEFEATVGILTPGDGGTLRLETIPKPNAKDDANFPVMKDIVLTRLPDANGGPKLDDATEGQLDWGEPVNGLRGAVMIRKPGAGKPEGICLVVQNVSDAPVRFVDKTKVDRLRTLYLGDTKGILAGLSNDEPTMTDVTLQPREVVFLDMMRSDATAEVAAGLIEGIRKDSLQTWRAVLRMKDAPDGAWKGELTTGETRCALREGGPLPKSKEAQALFKHWQSSARLNGDIPGGLVRLLHGKVQEFIRNNEPDASGGPYAQKMKPLEPRFASTGDWKAADVVSLLDDIAAASTIPLETTLDHLRQHTLQRGQPLPPAYAKADWGPSHPSGLRMAYVLEPRSDKYALGSEVKARIVLHNSGDQPVAFVTGSFHQMPHSARREDGQKLAINATSWTTRSLPVAYRLAPGECCELLTPGLGIGEPQKDRNDWANVRAGSWIRCAELDTVLFQPGPVSLVPVEGKAADPEWWLHFITGRLEREAPVPTDKKEKEYLLYRVVSDLFGTAPSTTEGDAFAADDSPDALKNLTQLLLKHAYGRRADGPMTAGETRFTVLPPDPEADKRPRVVTGPGWYSLSDSLKFSVTRRPHGDSVANEASIIYLQQGKENAVTKVPLPYGYDTWAAAMMKDAQELWIAEAGSVRKYDFTNPLQLVETRYQAGEALLAKALRGALDPVLSKSAADAPKSKQSSPPPAEAPIVPATEKPKGAEIKLTSDALLGTWRGTVNGEKLMLSFHRPPAEKDVQCDIYFGEATIGVPAGFTIAADGSSAEVVQHSAGGGMKFGTLIPDESGKLKLELYGRQVGQQETVLTRDPEAASTGPQQKEARALFEIWKETANADGTIPGTFIGMLATEVRAYVKANPTLDSAAKLPKLLPRFVTSRDWTQAEAIKLLDEVAHYSTKPIEARVAKAKLANGPLWRTMVEFQDIPVKIAKWSEAKDGLRIGMRVAGGQWSAGGSVRVELWLHNESGKDVSFRTAGPNRQDVEVMFSALNAEGQEHRPEPDPTLIFAPLLDCTLPAGYVAMAKEFDVTIAGADNDVSKPPGHRFRDLKPGDYQLRSVLMLANPEPAKSEKHIELKAPDFAFTLGGAAAADGAKPAGSK